MARFKSQVDFRSLGSSSCSRASSHENSSRKRIIVASRKGKEKAIVGPYFPPFLSRELRREKREKAKNGKRRKKE